MNLDQKRHCLKVAPLLAIGNDVLGFRLALEDVFPATKELEYSVRKTAYILDRIPKKIQPDNLPAVHWFDIRIANPIESTIATVCHRCRD